jgi:DNA (cytosine-5)-methyltransferase 1
LRQSGIRCKAKPIYPTLVAMVQMPIIFDKVLNKFRYLTVKEAAKLQSFNKKFKPHDKPYAAYKQFGNAVNAKVVKEVAKFYF